MPSTDVAGSKRWYRQDVVLLLSSLNFHIYQIQQELLEEEKHGIGFATELLSDCLPDGCTPARVGRKLYSIWNSKGAEGSKVVDLYRHGAYPRTLPFLDMALLQDIATTVRNMQKSSPSTKAESMAILKHDSIRRSERRTRKNIDDDPIECRCKFSHYASSCIHCDGCATWQHIFCYYGNDTEDPETHLCDQCTPDKTNNSWRSRSTSKTVEEDFVKSMERLNIRFDDVDDRMAKRLTTWNDHNKAESCIDTLDLLKDDEQSWGLTDSEVSRMIQLISYQIGRLADSVPLDHSSTYKLSKKFLVAGEELKMLLAAVLGNNVEKKSDSDIAKEIGKKAIPSSFFSALISTAIQQWVFYSSKPDTQSLKAVSFGVQQDVILATYGFRALRNIHRATWLSLLYENPEQIKHIITNEADDLSRRLLSVLEPLIVSAEESKSSSAIKEWINSTRDGKSRHQVILQIFSASLKLKARLPLAEQYFELYFPSLGTPFFRESMKVEGEDIMDIDVTYNSTVQFCIMPGIIEYPTNVFTEKTESVRALFGPHNYVKATTAERKRGRVICHAVVTLQQPQRKR